MKSLRFLSLCALALANNVIADEKTALQRIKECLIDSAHRKINITQRDIEKDPIQDHVEHFVILENKLNNTKTEIQSDIDSAKNILTHAQETTSEKFEELYQIDINTLKKTEQTNDSEHKLRILRLQETAGTLPSFSQINIEAQIEYQKAHGNLTNEINLALDNFEDGKQFLIKTRAQEIAELEKYTDELHQELNTLPGQFKARCTEILSADQVAWIENNCNNSSNLIAHDTTEYQNLKFLATKNGDTLEISGDIDAQGNLTSSQAKKSDVLLTLAWAIQQAQDKQNIPFGLYTCNQKNAQESRDYKILGANISSLTLDYIKHPQPTTCITCYKNEAAFQATLAQHNEKKAAAAKIEEERVTEQNRLIAQAAAKIATPTINKTISEDTQA